MYALLSSVTEGLFKCTACATNATFLGFNIGCRPSMSEVLGMVQRIQRPGNRWTAYQHDGLGKIIRADYYDDTWETFGYDKNGLLMETEKEHVTVKLERDPSGQVIKEWQNDHWISSSYDELGNRSKITSSLGAKIDVARSEMGNVSQITASRLEQEQWTASMQYNELGQEIERILPGDVISKWQYDATGRPTHHRISSQKRDTRRRAYNWDVNNRLRSMVNELTGIKVTYGYDEFSNLVWSNEGGQFDFLHRSVDDVGNLYETKEKTDRVYGAGSRLLETSEATFSYDDEGNLIQKVEKNGDTWQYEYYGNGMMAKVIKPDDTEVTFKYDSLGRRIEKCSDEKTSSFVWDGNTILHEYFSQNDSDKFDNLDEDSSQNNSEIPDNIVTWVFNERFVPSAKITNEGNYSIISDYLGTPIESFDEEGNKVWSAELDIFGRVKEFTYVNDFIPFRYQGQYEDIETGLYYNRFRYYSPAEGMYTQQDPIGLSGGMVLYEYVKDTNTQFDPLGWITVFRALNGAQESQALNNEPIIPKNSTANYSIQEHIDDGKLNTQYISTTKKQRTAEFYAKPNPKRGKMTSSTIIAIDTDKLDSNKVFDVSNGVDPQTGKPLRNPAYKFATKDAEVLIQGEIPKNAYTIHKKGRCR